MSEQNKTSQAIVNICINKAGHSSKWVEIEMDHLFAIAAKYKRMEEALKRAINNSECFCFEEPSKKCVVCQCCEAYDYDPLAQ